MLSRVAGGPVSDEAAADTAGLNIANKDKSNVRAHTKGQAEIRRVGQSLLLKQLRWFLMERFFVLRVGICVAIAGVND